MLHAACHLLHAACCMLLDSCCFDQVAQNVLEYYVHQKEKLQRGVQQYSEAQGKGFICWRFINEFRQ